MSESLTILWNVFPVLFVVIIIIGEYIIFSDAVDRSRKEFYGNNAFLIVASAVATFLVTLLISIFVEVYSTNPKAVSHVVAIVIGGLIVKEILYQIYKRKGD